MSTYPELYVSYLIEFHATRDFFECHELLEEYWKEHPGDEYEIAWVGFIQLAVGQYHERRGNRRGAEKMYEQANLKLRTVNLAALGIDKQHLLEQLSKRMTAVSGVKASEYKDINMEFTDKNLLALCQHACLERGLEWGMPSPLQDEAIIHRHSLRDRSDVISTRLEALLQKEKERNGIE